MNDEFWSRAFARGSESVFKSFLIEATKSLIKECQDVVIAVLSFRDSLVFH